MNREITCIVCPNGCTLNIDFEKNADGKIAVTSVSAFSAPPAVAAPVPPFSTGSG